MWVTEIARLENDEQWKTGMDIAGLGNVNVCIVQDDIFSVLFRMRHNLITNATHLTVYNSV